MGKKLSLNRRLPGSMVDFSHGTLLDFAIDIFRVRLIGRAKVGLTGT